MKNKKLKPTANRNKQNEMDHAKRTIHFKKLADMVRDNTLSPLERLLLVDLLLYAGVSGEAFPTQKTLAKDLGCTSRHIRNSLYALMVRGLIDWKTRPDRKSNIYSFSKELHFRTSNEVENYTSAPLGSGVPNKKGTLVPTNVTQLNNSSNVINNKYSSLQDISDEDIREISFEYKVPEGLVRLQLEALRNYCTSKGKRYKNYKAALRNFVIREAKSEIERRALHGNKRGIDATGI